MDREMDSTPSTRSTGDWAPTPKEGKTETGRGATKMSKIVRARHKGKVFHPSWNHNGLPIGPDSISLASYWGSTVRRSIPITIPDWKHVPKRLTDSLFEEVVVCSIFAKLYMNLHVHGFTITYVL